MKLALSFVLLAALLMIGGFFWHLWKQGESRRTSLQTLQQLNSALVTANSAQLLELISLPTALAGRTAAEQSEFLVKALRDEVSADGLAVLQHDGAFGPLTNLFPTEARTWSSQAGVPAEACVAFKLERNGLRAEVVLVRIGESGDQNPNLRVLRCNNVKQLAQKR